MPAVDAGPVPDGAMLDAPGSLDAGPGVDAPRPDTGPRPDAGPIVPCTGLGGVTVSNVVAGLHPDAGVVHPGTRTLLSLPQGVSPSLAGIAAVVVEDDALTVRTLPVTFDGDFGGRVTASVWSPGLNRMISVAYASSPFRYELLATEIRADGVTITPLTSTDPIDPDGPYVGALYASGTSIVAMRGDGYHVVSIDLGAGTATWGSESTLDTANRPMNDTYDAMGGRLVGYGTTHFTPPSTVTIDPGIATRSLLGGWSPAAVSGGMAPPSTDFTGGSSTWIAYEPTSARLFVVQYHTVTSGPFGPHMIPGLWSAPVAGGSWTLHVDEYYEGQTLYDGPYAMDVMGQRTLELGLGLSVRSLAPGSEGDLVSLEMDGELTPRFPEAAARLGDGRLVALSNDRFHVLDPSEPAPRWTSLGTATAPEAHHFAPALAFDHVGDRLLVLGGSRSSSDAPTSFVVSALSADGTTLTSVATTGTGPGALVRHSAIVVDDEVIVVGGLAGTFTGTVPAETGVFALDLSTLAWRRVGALSGPTMSAALRVQPDGRLWVIGGYSATDFVGTASIESIDLASGVTSPVVVTGAWPPADGGFTAWTGLGDGVLGIDVGGTIDESGGQLWQLVPDGAASAHWVGGDACTSDYAFYEILGVPDAGDDGWIVGHSSWRFSI